MDYIKSKLERKIRFIEANSDEANLKIYYQVRIEYSLIFLLGYLWNKNLDRVELDTKENIYQTIGRPSIGTIVSICRSLDIDKEVFKNRKVSEAIDKYPVLRNEKIGHGYVFEGGAKEFLQAMKELYEAINSLNSPLFNQSIDFVKVTKQEGNLFKGISFKSNGSDFDLWFCPQEVATFEIGSLYVCINSNQYFRISPFIEIDNEDEIFVFASIDEKLLGKVKYNKILQDGKKYKEWEELCELDIENDGLRRKSQNGTILNIYENNYKKYFDTGVKKKIEHFLLKNRASVCATVWGHGGVGKTATV
jgi:flagellar biosynthesis GTPase FlhF